ncbi:hypothetical protein O6H91_06G080300 [Diphasiastrum complanatum]|uniref:Uncharacterized protein n=1 Tax=Diphasiastrum complanatum TaxID=34168 RepID=A0ACC2DFF6_DIPCM|nr:hypothetical protein O6H91_06G080300 [Diphasiastrum complanatum]
MLKVVSRGADWEIVDDDGFVYKRPKKATEIETGSGANGELCARFQSFEQYRNSISPAFEEARHKRKELLLTMRNKYAAELQQWKDLFSKQSQEAERMCLKSTEPSSSAVTDYIPDSLGDPYQEAHIELSGQVEELEQFIKECTDICDQADNIVRLLDEDIQKTEEQLFRPLCISPRQIFANIASS